MKQDTKTHIELLANFHGTTFSHLSKEMREDYEYELEKYVKEHPGQRRDFALDQVTHRLIMNM